MKNKIIDVLQQEFGEHRIRQNEPMNMHTTWKVGGTSEFYMETEKTEEIIKAVQLSKKYGYPLFIYGGGSNIFVSGNGISGLTIKNNCRRFDMMSVKGAIKQQKLDVSKAIVYAESGAIMNQLVRFTVEEGLQGLEYQLGLPGTVGGALHMNSNFPKKQAYVGDAIERVRLVTRDGEVKDVDKAYFRFAYDQSILQETGEIVLSAVFSFTATDKRELWQRGMEAVQHRNETQPKGFSAGCTFRNISIAQALIAKIPDNITSAGYLIDKAGLKGKRIGDAIISDKHANFIMNLGSATPQDVVELVSLIKKTVLQKFGVHLELEVKQVGF